MARQGITQEQVNETANMLINDGIIVTVQTLRDRLGSGSFSTLSKHLTVWKTGQDKIGKIDIPELPAKVDQAFKQVWAIVWKATQDDVKAERESLETTRKNFEVEKNELLSEVTKLESQLETKEQEIEEVKNSLISEKEKSDLLITEKTALQIENARLSEKCKTVESLEIQVKNLQDQLIEIAKGNKITKT
jgi:regulator of replication initiation timing